VRVHVSFNPRLTEAVSDLRPSTYSTRAEDQRPDRLDLLLSCLKREASRRAAAKTNNSPPKIPFATRGQRKTKEKAGRVVYNEIVGLTRRAVFPTMTEDESGTQRSKANGGGTSDSNVSKQFLQEKREISTFKTETSARRNQTDTGKTQWRILRTLTPTVCRMDVRQHEQHEAAEAERDARKVARRVARLEN
jgi:hypothetical protein